MYIIVKRNPLPREWRAEQEKTIKAISPSLGIELYGIFGNSEMLL